MGDGLPGKEHGLDARGTKMNLKGEVAIVSGSGRGLGRAIVDRLAELGADVAVHDVSANAPAEFGEAKDINEVAQQLRKYGGKVAPVTGDLTKKATWPLWSNLPSAPWARRQ